MSNPVTSFFTQIFGVLGSSGPGWYPVQGASQGMAPFRTVASDSGKSISAGASLQLAAVWACVRLISETIATLPLQLKQPDSEGKLQIAAASAIYKMLKMAPNLYMTGVEFWEMMLASICLWGNAYARKQKVAGRVVALFPLRPEFVTVYLTDEGAVRYTYARGTEREDFSADDILHIKGFGVDGLVGLSPIAMARQTLGRSIATDEASGRVFQSGLSAGGFITYDKALTAEQRDGIRDRISDFTGSDKFGKTMVLENGMGYEAISLHPDDAQMLESRQFNVEEICRWFRVPPQLIGHITKQSSWASSVEATTLGFLKFGLMPYLVRIEQAVVRSLGLSSDSVLKFSVEGLLRGDSDARAALYSAFGQNGVFTRNEIRALEDRDPLPGGDELTVQSNLVPLSKLGTLGGKPAAPEPAAKPPAAKPPVEPDDGESEQ